MNCIIVILGVSQEDYLAIREDLQNQIRALGVDPMPLFTRLPADYTGIEIVWVEEPGTTKTSNDPELNKLVRGVESGKIRYPWEAIQALKDD